MEAAVLLAGEVGIETFDDPEHHSHGNSGAV